MTDDLSEQPDATAAATAGDAAGDTYEAAAPEAVERTGNPAIDSVLASLDSLADIPVADHVAVFEAAHDQLRSALAGAGDSPAHPQH